MPEVAPQLSYSDEPPVKLTAVDLDCDPECKWKKAFAEAEVRRDLLKAVVIREPYEGNPDDLRPTAQGYNEIREIGQRYAGLEILISTGNLCVAPCAIEKLIDNPDRNLGSEIKNIINELR